LSSFVNSHFQALEWNHESINLFPRVFFLVHDNMNHFMFAMIRIILIRFKKYSKPLNRFI